MANDIIDPSKIVWDAQTIDPNKVVWDNQPAQQSLPQQLGESFRKTGVGLVRGVAEPIVKNVIGRPLMALESLISKQPPVGFNYPFPKSLGGDIPINPLQNIPQAIGAGAQTAGLGLSPGLGGLLYGAGGALEEGKNPAQITLEGLLGGILGKVGGMAIGGEPLLKGKLAGLAQEKLVPALKQSAEASYQKVLGKVTTKEQKLTAEKLVPEMVSRKPFVFTREGLKNVSEKKSNIYGTKIEDAWAKLSPDERIPIEPMVKSIDNAQKGLEINGVIIKQNEAEHEVLQRMKTDLINIANEPNKISPQTLRDYRQQLDTFIAKRKKGFTVSDADSAVLSATKTMANSVRSEIAKKYPDIGKLNKEFSYNNKMYELLTETIKKQPKLLNQLGGIVTGHPGSPTWGIFVKNLGSLFSDNVAWNSLSGSMKSRFTDTLSASIKKGDIQGANNIVSRMGSFINNRKNKK